MFKVCNEYEAVVYAYRFEGPIETAANSGGSSSLRIGPLRRNLSDCFYPDFSDKLKSYSVVHRQMMPTVPDCTGQYVKNVKDHATIQVHQMHRYDR